MARSQIPALGMKLRKASMLRPPVWNILPMRVNLKRALSAASSKAGSCTCLLSSEEGSFLRICIGHRSKISLSARAKSVSGKKIDAAKVSKYGRREVNLF